MNRDDFGYRVSAQEIVYFKCMDKKPVHIISNSHDTEQATILRRQRDCSPLEYLPYSYNIPICEGSMKLICCSQFMV